MPTIDTSVSSVSFILTQVQILKILLRVFLKECLAEVSGKVKSRTEREVCQVSGGQWWEEGWCGGAQVEVGTISLVTTFHLHLVVLSPTSLSFSLSLSLTLSIYLSISCDIYLCYITVASGLKLQLNSPSLALVVKVEGVG